MKHLKSLRFAVQLLVLLLLASSLSAATVTTKYVILFDVDNSSATGCTYTVGTTSIAGIEHVLTTTVDRNGSTATVSKVERQQCSGGTFTAPITVDSTGWPATIGSDGALHVVTHIPNSVFGTTVPSNMRLYIGVLEGGGATFIETAPNGTPILYPTIGPRHRAVSHDGVPTEPMSPILDGTFAFFSGLPPMFLGPPVVTGTTQQLINSVFGYSGSTDLYFLFNIGGSVTGSLIAIDDSYTLQQGHGIGAGAPGVLTNDVNTTGSPMLAQLLTTTHLGTVTLNADGSFHYNNNGSALPVDSFTYKATAGGQTSDPATVTFHITPDNAPVGVTDSYTVAHAGTLNVAPPGVLLNDTDADHDPMTAVIATPPLHASSFQLNSNGSFNYTHDGSNTLSDTFTYRATDGIIPSFPVTVHITIGADQPPVGVADAYTTAEGSTLTVPAASGLLVNDTDVDTPHSSLTASVGTAPSHGNVVVNPDGSFVYTHNGSETTSDTFTYIVTDGITPAAPTTVTITITPVNDPPVLNNQTITLLEDTPTAINVTATDAEGDPLTYQLLNPPSHGSLSGTLPNVTYTPNANYNGTDSFVVVASDGKAQSAAATISLTITPVDDAPVAVNDVYAATPNATLTISAIVGVLANDYDVDGDSIQAVQVSGPSHASSFTLNADGSFSYTPNNGYTGTDSFTYKAQETTSGSLQSNVATVTFNIHGTNQAPVANDQTVSTNEDTPLGIVLTGSDPDGDAITFSANPPAHGVLSGTAPNLTYTPNANYNGTDSFTFTVSDGALTGNGTIHINIAPVNDAPVAAPDVYGTLKNTTLNVSAANGVLLNDSDVDGNTLTAVLDVNVAHGTLNLNSNGSFIYTPSNNFVGTDSFTYHAFDGSLPSGTVTVTLNVKNTNTPPTANSQTVTTNEDTAVAITLTGSDPDADPLSYTIATPPAHGTLSGAPPSVLYTPAASYSGSDSFTFTVSDGIATSAAATVSITINHVNHAPVANNDSFSTSEDSGVSGNVLTNDSDPDGDTMHAVLVGNVSNGTLNLNSDGSFTYTPNANFNGVDGFTYTANDASLASTVAHVTISVSSVNDVPTFTAGAGVTVLDTLGAYSSGWASSVSAGPADEAWQAVNFIVSNDNNSLFSVQPAISPSGVLTFTTITGQSGVANVTVRLHDNGGTANGGVDTTTAMTFTITVDKIPVITSANNTTFLVGTFGTFTTTASAHPPADFFESGALPTGVTFVNNGPPSSSSGTLSGTPATGTGGVYSISFTATNVRGSSAPQAFTLTVNEAPTIGTNPSSQAVCAGATATFTASAATGFPAPTVQWQISTDGGTTYSNIGGATSTTYSFATTAADNGHKFRAVFTNGFGTATTTAATLTVNTVPVVTTNPATQTICAGSLVTFTAAATGQPTPSVQWQVSTDGGATFNDIVGATSTTLSFTTAAADTGKQYRARFTNVCGANVTTTAATLTVDTAAVVTTNPVTQTICAGSPVTFTAAATSNASDHTVQWQVSTNGGTTWTNIGGATSTTLSFTTATSDNGKQYRAVFTDGCGNTPTSAATLTVDTLPVVTTNPVTQTICAGSPVTFTAAATSNASDHTVQWQVSTDSGATWNNIGGATSTTLSFTTAAGDNGKQYRAVFTDVCGSANTTAATLTVDTLPVVTVNPATQTLCAGATVSFTANATSNASDHTVQWQVSTNGGTTWTNIGGATSTTLSFTTATGDNGKQYRAVFTDVCGSTNTTAATLTVDTLPVVTTNPVTQTICAGATVNFTAAATSNASDHTVQWQVSIDNGATFNDIVGATSTTLSFTTAASDNTKQYRAVFTDACGSSNTTAATLTVDTLPVVTTDPATQTVCAGATVNFTAAATSNASDHTVQWQVSTDSGATWNNIVGATSTTLSFVAANGDNTKEYRAVFTDVCGSANSAAALLTVDSLPVVTTDPVNQTICSGATATFTAAATSNAGDHTVQWQVSTDSGATWNNIGGATSTTLSFTPVNGDTGKQYRAVFTDACGSTPTAAATLRVDTLPVVSTNPLTQTDCAGGTATFTAAATSNAGQTVQWQLSTDGGATFNNIAGATSTTLSFTPVAGDNGHQYRAVFTNSCGTATTSAATLTVDTIPVVTTNPLTQTVCSGATATFTAAATSNASDHTVQWQVSTDSGATWNNIGGATSTTLSFATAPGDNTKQYRAVFTDACGSTPTSAATLTVDTLPVVTTNPVTQTICAGSPVTFTAAATSNANDHTVQWQVSTDGGATWNNIGGATSTTLSFTTAAADNAKKYRAVFTDVCGSTPTSAATLTVDTLPVVTTNPLTQTVCSGATATFTAAATSNASDHTVQWQVSTNGGTTWNNIGGATSTTLSFATAPGDNTKQYRAVFTDACGSSNTTAATLTVDTIPVVTTNPLTQTLCAGATVNFTAAATSNASDHTVQWQVSTDGGATFNNIVGATSTTLSFSTVAGDNGHKFRAVFTDACGSSNTTAATLTVDTIPVMATQPSNATVCSGTLASFTATATSNASDHTVQWQISTDGGTTFTNIGGATSTTYSFTTAADGSDSGHKFQAVFTDACGTTTSNVATLTVNVAPAVTGTPASTTVCAGSIASFTASASGTPSPTVQWQVSTDGGATWNNIPGATSTTLSFTSSAADTGKQYRAVFTNVCNTATTSAATLTVNTAPSVTAQPSDTSVVSGSTASFTSTASGTPSPTVQWQLSTDGGTTFNNIAGATSTTYTTPTTTLSDSGKKYRAVFTNSCGTATSNVATLTVTCPTITVARVGGGSFPSGTYNTAYTGQSVSASGGSGTYTFAVTSGALPTNLSLSSAGAISGTPTKTGTFNFTITATDSNTNCTGSQAFSIQIKPAAAGDSYNNLVNNTQAVVTGGTTSSPATPFVGLTGTIIANDLPTGGVTAVAGTVSSANGTNNVVIAADGTFIYTPPVTASPLTTDTFTYTISSDTGATGTATTATGTVTLNLANRVWYVKNNGAGTLGQSQSPFTTLAAAQTASTANDIIYVYNGDGTTTGQTAGITLKSGQQLIGQGVALVVNTNTLVAAGTKPQITNTAATSDVVTLNAGNTVKGVTITGATRDGIAGNTQAGFTADTITIQNSTSSGLHLTSMTGTVTVTNATISGNGTGLDINNGTAAISLDNTNTITANAGQRSVSIQNRPASAGTIALGASITDNGTGILVNANTSGTINFTGTQTLSTTTNTAVALTTNSGATINFSGTLGITTTTGTGFTASGGGTLSVSGTANVTTGAAPNAVNINGMTLSGTPTFNSVNATGATTAINLVSFVTAGTVAVNGGTISNGTTGVSLQGTNTSLTLAGVTINGPTTGITNTTNFGTLTIGASVNVSAATALNLATGAISGTFANVSSTGGTNGVNLNAVTGSWGATAGSLTGATGTTFNVTGGSGGTISWGGTINQANGALVVSISGSNSNTINYSGNVTTSGASTGISISGNSGTYNFTGGTSTIAGTGGGIVIANESGTISFGSGYAISGSTTSFKIGGSATNVSANITYSGTINNTANGGVVLDVNSASGTFNGTLTMNGTSLVGNSSNPAGMSSTIKNMTGTLTVNNLSETASSTTASSTLVGISGTNTGGSFTFNHMTLSAAGANNVVKGFTVAAGSGGTYTITATGGTSSIGVGSTALSMDGTGNAVTLGASAIATLSSLGNGSAGAVILTAVSGGGATTISAGTLTGVNGATTFLVSGGTPNLTFGGTISQANGNPAVSITGVGSGCGTCSLSFTNTITKSGTAANGVSITSNTAGTYSFSGAITASTSTANAINLTTNTGATISFSGNLTLTTTTGTAFNATGGGTVTATNASSTVSETGAGGVGIGVNIANTTIGAGNVTFFSVNANGGSAGISINTTGSTGSFIVTGTVASVTKDNSGGVIQNMTGTDGTANGHGIYLNSTKNVSIKHMSIQGNQGDGIHASSVNGATVQYCNIGTVSANGTSTAQLGSFSGEGDAQFVDLTTSALIDNNAFANAFHNTLTVLNNNATSINRVVITNNTFGTQNAANGNDGVTLQATGGTFNATFSNNSVTYAIGDSFQLDLHGTISSDLIMSTNTLANTAGAAITPGGGGVTIGGGGASDKVTLTFNISNNTITGAAGAGFGMSTGQTGVLGFFSNYSGSITNNTIGNTGVTDSGSTTGGDLVVIDWGSPFNVSITGNHLSQYNPATNGAMQLQAGDDAGNVANFVATVTGNVISNPGSNASNVMQGIAINIGPSSTDVSKACFTMFSNTLTGSGKNGGSELRVRQRASTHIGLLGNGSNYSGAANDTTAVATFEAGQNTVTSTASVSAATNSPGGFQGTCP